MRIVLTGGGTGGHLTPLVAVARVLRELAARSELPGEERGDKQLELLYVGVVTDGDRAVLEAEGIPSVHVPSGKIRRYLSGSHRTVIDLLVRLPLGIARALRILFFVMPDVVFSKGGYGCFPVVVAARLYRIPVLLHETDLIPGVANRSLSRYASAIAVSFRSESHRFPKKKVFVSGTPLRRAFEQLPDMATARERLGLHDVKPVVFVTGGSQGAQRINTTLLAVLPRLLSIAQVVHQVGEKNFLAVRDFVGKDLRTLPGIEEYHAAGFLSESDMANAYAAASLVISRAGGTSLAEIAAAAKPAILIPLRESAQQHQWENAYFFREHGAAVVLDEANLTPELFLSTVERTLQSSKDLALMADRVRRLHHPGGAEELARMLVAMAQGKVPRTLETPQGVAQTL